MRLRSKLLLVSLSLLALPWAGWRFVIEFESLLRRGQEQALLAAAEAVARGVAQRAEALPEDGLFVHPLASTPALDGEAADWGPAASALRRTPFSSAGERGLGMVLGRAGERLFLFARVDDPSLERAEAHWSNAPARDHLQLRLSGPNGLIGLRLANAASGPLRQVGLGAETLPLRLDGWWQETEGGYVVELALPQGYPVKRLGLVAQDAEAGEALRVSGTERLGAQLLPLVEPRPELADVLAALAPPHTRLRLYEREGWRLAEAGSLDAPAPVAGVPAWRRLLYRWLLMGEDEVRDAGRLDGSRSEAPELWQALSGVPATAWRRDDFGQRQWLSAAVPVAVGAETRAVLVLERENDAALQLADRALTGLLWTTLLALLGAGGVVFAFATRLGWRVRRLRDAAEQALDRDGRVRGFPASSARDEIGDLSRSFARLVEAVGQQTDYLRGLAGTLSHELNTPIAIVRSSLDNLDQSRLSSDAATYVERARSGAERLDRLVRALSEASRLERAMASTEAEDFDLRALLAASAEAYRPLLAPRRLELVLPPQPLRLHGAPDLISQGLDKLVDNARGFCPEDGWLRLTLEARSDGAVLRLANSGPPLPPGPAARLFESLVSLRPRSAEAGLHLGFGLAVVRLVARLHQGEAEAHNLPGGDGVEFSLRLRGMPRVPAAAAVR